MKNHRLLIGAILAVVMFATYSIPVLANDPDDSLADSPGTITTKEEKDEFLQQLQKRREDKGSEAEKIAQALNRLTELAESDPRYGEYTTLVTRYLSGFDSESYGNGVFYLDFDWTIDTMGFYFALDGYSETAWTGTTPEIYCTYIDMDQDWILSTFYEPYAGITWSLPSGDPGDWDPIENSVSYDDTQTNVFAIIHDIDSEDPLEAIWMADYPGGSLIMEDREHHYIESTNKHSYRYADDQEYV